LLVSYYIVNAEELQRQSKDSTQLQTQKAESACLEDYIQVIRSISHHSPADAKNFQSIMASGRYSACDVIKIIDKYYKR